MNTSALQEADEAVRKLVQQTKVAFVPSPAVQSQMQRLQQIAASQGSDQQAIQQASEQAKAQGQGGPPMMRIEDLAGMLNEAFSQLGQMLQQILASVQQPVAPPAPAAPAQPQTGEAPPAATGEKKPKKDDLILQQLTEMNQLLRQAVGAPPSAAVPSAAGPAPAEQPPAQAQGQPA